MNKIKINIPYIPDSPNKQLNKHWGARSRYNNKIKEEVGWLIREQFRTAIPEWHKADITFQIWNSRYDEDNTIASTKPILDGIKESGIIDDDSPKHIKLKYQIGWMKGFKGKGITVTIKKIET